MDEAKEKGRYRTYYDAITSFISISHSNYLANEQNLQGIVVKSLESSLTIIYK